MRRALLWLLVGLVLFLLVAALLAPGGLVLRALGLSAVAVVPALAVVVLTGDQRRRRRPAPPDTAPETPDDGAE